MPRKNDFWGNFSRTVDFQPAGNLLATMILADKKKQEEADAQFYKQQQELRQARETRQRIEEAYNKLISGTKDVTTFEDQNKQPELRSTVNPDGSLDLRGGSYKSPFIKARTEKIPLTVPEKINLGLNADLTFEQIQKLSAPKKKEYSAFQEDPYVRYGRNKDTNQWELLETFDKTKDQINPAYKGTTYVREFGDIPQVEYDKTTGDRFYVTRKGRYDPKADRWDKDEKGNIIFYDTQRTKVTETNQNGDDVLNKSLKTNLDNLFKTQMMLNAQLNNASNNPNGVVVDQNGKQVFDYEYDKYGQVLKKTPVTAEDIKNRLIAHKRQTKDFLDNLSSETLNSWKEAVDGSGMNADQYWNTLQEGFVKGWKGKDGKVMKLNDYDLQIGSMYYQLLYNRIPQNYYGEE